MAITAASAKFRRLNLSAASVEGLGDKECSTKASTWYSIALANDILLLLPPNSAMPTQVVVAGNLRVDASQGYRFIRVL
jgi:hypothetical protein